MKATPFCLTLAGLLWVAGAAPAVQHPFPVAQANDNRHPAGRLRRDTLRVSLIVRMATWFPEADGGPSVTVAAFGEPGKPPRIPGPLLRRSEERRVGKECRL